MNHSWAAPSRRGLIGAGAGLAAGAAAQLLAGKAEAARGMATLDQLKRAERDPDHRILLRGGIVLSLDPGIGNFEAGDVLIGGKKILAVGRNLNSTASVVDASGMIVMPGFVDTHHHQYETILRGTLADGVLGSPNDGKKTYQGVIQGIFTPVYQPEDAYISELVASLNQLNAGVTTTVDTLLTAYLISTSPMALTRLLASTGLPSRETSMLRTMSPPPGIAQVWNFCVFGSNRTIVFGLANDSLYHNAPLVKTMP